MRILSWNLLRHDGAGVDDIADLVGRYHPDLLLMQEATERIDRLPDRLGGDYVRRTMPERRHGLAAWSSRPFKATVAPLPQGGRLDLPPPVRRSMAPRFALIVTVDGVAVATVHLDHGQWANRRQLRHLGATRPALAAIIGDFNAVGPTPLAGFHDVGPRVPTHCAWGVLPLRLDRCLARVRRADDARALGRGRSDHRAVLLELRVDPLRT